MLSNFQKKVTIGVCCTLAVLGLIYGTVFMLYRIYIQPAKVKQMLINQVQRRFDRTITLGDDISITLSWDMSPNIILNDFTLSNSSWAAHKNIFTADTIELSFSLIDLLFNNLTIHAVKLTKPILYAEVQKDKDNLEELYHDTNSLDKKAIEVEVKSVAIKQGTIYYNLDKFFIDNLYVAIRDNEQEFDVNLKGSHANEPFEAIAKVEITPDNFKLELDKLLVEKTDLAGNLEIEYSPVKVKGEFYSNNFALNNITDKNTDTSGEYFIPKVEIPVAKIRDSEFDVKAKFGKVIIAGVDIGNVEVHAKNNSNVIEISLQPAANIANGTLNLDISYDLNPDVPTLDFKAKTSTLKFEDVLQEMFGSSPLTGSSFDFNAHLSGIGSDLNSLVASLDGKILITAGPGEFLISTGNITSIFTNVLTNIITFEKDRSSTQFKCGVMNFTVKDGIANANRGIGIEAAHVKVLGDGKVDLRNGRISFSMSPQTVSVNPLDFSKFSLAQFVTVKGTLSNPEMSINSANVVAKSTGAILGAGLGGVGGITSVLTGRAMTSQSSNNSNISPCEVARQN